MAKLPKLIIGKLLEGHAVQREIVCFKKTFTLRPRKTTEKLDMVCRSQGLADACGILAGS